MNVAGVVVTRGNVDLTAILESFTEAGLHEFVVWDNSRRPDDLGVYGRYAAIHECESPVIYVQDDDCLIDVARVVAAYEPGRLVANMPMCRWRDYPDSTLVGWGAVFDRILPAVAWMWLTDEMADGFHRTCDVAFTALTPRTIIDVGFQHLPWAEGSDRMFRQRGHKQERDRMLELCRRVRVADDDVRVAA